MKNSLLKNDPQIARGTQKNCNDCQKKFSIIVRQHQCKRCLKPVCSECGNFRGQIYGVTFTLREHRICKNCKQCSSFISESVKNEDLQFGQTRDTGRKWLKRMTIKPSTFGTDTSQHKVFSKQAFSELWGSYSFELRELVGMLTYKFQQNGVYEVVYNVYATVISAAPQFSFAQVIHLIVYVLCFCASDKAPFIVLYLLELKQNQKDFKTLAFNYLKALPFKNELQKLESYINYRLDKYADSFLVNCLTIECSKSLITKIFEKRNVEELLIYFATHIYANRQLLVSKINENKSFLDNIMLRNCKLEQLTSCYKYFKGKSFSASFNQTEDLQYLSLKKMKTMNYDHSYSPRSQILEDKIKPKLVSREVFEENSRDIDDSFSFYIQPDKQNTLKKSPSEMSSKSNKIILENQFSPQVKIIGPNQESPFRKTVQQEAPIEQVILPTLLEFTKPIRKNTDGPDYDRNTVKNCQNCTFHREQFDSVSKRYNEDKLKWNQQKQKLQQSNEELSHNIEKYMTEDFAKKSRIGQLQKINNQNQTILKQSNEKLNSLQQLHIKNEQINEKSRAQLKQLNEKLMNETNDNIKLAASLQKQKRNVKEAREMCIQTNKISEGLKLKQIEMEALLNQLAKKEVTQKETIKNQQSLISNYKQKISQFQQRQASMLQKSANNSHLETLYSESKRKNQQLHQLLIQKDKQLQKGQAIEEQLKKSKRELEAIQNNNKQMEYEISNKNNENNKTKRQLQVIIAQHENLKEQLKQIILNNQQKDLQIKRQKGEMETLQNTKRQIQLQINNKNNENTKIKTELEVKVSQNTNLKEKLRQITLSNQKTTQQKSKLSSELLKNKVKDEQISKLKNEIQALQIRKKQFQNQLNMVNKDNNQMKAQLEALASQNASLKENLKEITIKNQISIKQKSKLSQDLLKNSHVQSEQSIKLIDLQAKIRNLTLQLTEKSNQIQALSKQSNQANISLIQQKIGAKKMKEELANTKKQKNQSQQQLKNIIKQLEQQLTLQKIQIQKLHQQKQQLQSQNSLHLQMNSQRSEFNLQLSNIDQQSSSQDQMIIKQKQLEIKMLSELSQRQQKVIEEQADQIKRMEQQITILNQKILFSTKEYQQLKRNIVELQLQIDNYKRQNQIASTNCNNLTQQLYSLRSELDLQRSQSQKRESKELIEAKNSLTKVEAKNKELLVKLSDISELMMQIEQQKMELADELFGIHEFLKSKGIHMPK